ncbi:M20/M25/M40 family metallo-hydrolase [Halalkalibacter alkalisediminis]|uniref:M20/M25/M40 family metallo-hydrolase n=1 Tax=Halalkalibacter alkalisediminis TaxID=935616 RepID=A0ABV6NP57_9BACI|nr:M20/M25/M40 family metallo-hydrolase [Halalkalibacter alkalisediminis]
MSNQLFTSEHSKLLLDLLEMNTVSPMETGRLSEIPRAQKMYANYAVEKSGGNCEIVYHQSPDPSILTLEDVPISIRECAHQLGHLFWENQSNLVLRFGQKRPVEKTIMFNFHIDTVDGMFPVTFDGETYRGRGAVDMKGPGVALLAGIQAAVSQKADLLDDTSILIQCVSGEEGGAMGFYGTKQLADKGYIGRFNLFAEPSGGVYFDRSSTSMTARIDVFGQDSTDDAPDQGHNATLLLGYVAQRLMKELPEQIEKEGGKMCLAGLHTGNMHNKVYGSGQLLLNFAYVTTESGRQIKAWVEEAFLAAVNRFRIEFSSVPTAAATVKEAKDISQLTWIKQGLPVLMNRHAELEHFLGSLGLKRNPDDQVEKAFTCDAMWVQANDVYTVVYGPGSLEGNLAHAKGEYINKRDLERYASFIYNLLLKYSAIAQTKSTKELNI